MIFIIISFSKSIMGSAFEIKMACEKFTTFILWSGLSKKFSGLRLQCLIPISCKYEITKKVIEK
jgi:hypothetical protein